MTEVVTNGWNEYKQRVFYQLDQLTERVEKLDGKVDKLREDVVVLKVKAWAFGVIGGGAVLFLFEIAKTLINK